MSDAFLYEVVHRASGRAYVGVAQDVTKRWRAHRNLSARGSQTHFHRALRKYGREAFDWSVVAWCSSFDEALDAEREEIAARGRGFNQTDGGEGTLGFRHPPEVRAAIGKAAGDAMRGKPKSDEHRAATSDWAQRRALTAEGHQHLRQLGLRTAERRRNGLAPPVVYSDDARAKMSASAKARCTPEWRAAHAARRRGAKASAETRAKLSVARLKYPPGTACVTCSCTDKRIQGRGQCKTCYQREYARRKRNV